MCIRDRDVTAPTAVCQNITVQLDANGAATITASQIDNGSSDNCGIALLSVSPSAFDCNDLGPNTVTLTVKDLNGNITTCSATVTVEDNIDPTITCAPTAQIYTNIGCTYAGPIGQPTVTDNCSAASITNDAPAVFALDTTIVTWTVTDQSGNCLLYTSPSPRDRQKSRMPSSA